MKELKVTLYDIFGYLVPGFVVLIGLYVICLGVFQPSAPIRVFDLSPTGWIVIAFLSYLLGHFSQSLANLLFRGRNSLREVKSSQAAGSSIARMRTKIGYIFGAQATANIPAPLMVAAKRKFEVILGAPPGDVDDATVLGICSRMAKLCEGSEADEWYGSREGFYRGLCAGFVALAIGTAMQLWRGAMQIETGGKIYILTRPEVASAFITFLVLTILAVRRFHRFSTYRTIHSVVIFVFGYTYRGTSGLPEAKS